MQENWSLLLNVLLLIGVMVAIGNMLKTKRKYTPAAPKEPAIGPADFTQNDDIIAVRKIMREELEEEPVIKGPKITSTEPFRESRETPKPSFSATSRSESPIHQRKPVISITEEEAPSLIERKPAPKVSAAPASPSVMMFLLAKEGRQLAGYELLQTVLASGLRFGDGHLFHRHQYANGQGPVLCSLAAATPTGVFDLQNIGAFKVRGLCLFMQASGNPTIDAERFEIMLDTAKQLSDGLDADLLDDKQKPFSDASLASYHLRLNLEELEAESEPA